MSNDIIFPKRNQKYFMGFYDGEEYAVSHINIVCKIIKDHKHDVSVESTVTAMINALVKQYDNFRMSFPKNGEQRIVKVFDNIAGPVLVHEVCEVCSQEHWEQYVRQVAHEEYSTKFMLENGLLYRFKLLQRSSEEAALVMTFHHAIMDFWSLKLIKRFFLKYLKDSGSQGVTSNGRSPQPYIESVIQEGEFLASSASQDRRQFWQEYLLGTPVPDSLSSAKPHQSALSDSKTLTATQFISALDLPIKQADRDMRLDQRDVAFAAYLLALERHIPSFNGIILVITSGRNSLNSKSMGFYSNVLPVKLSGLLGSAYESDSCAQELVQLAVSIKREVARCVEQYLPLSSIVEALHPKLDCDIDYASLDRWPSTHQFNSAPDMLSGSATDEGMQINYWPEVGAGRAHREFGTEFFISMTVSDVWLLQLTYNESELDPDCATAIFTTIKNLLDYNSSI